MFFIRKLRLLSRIKKYAGVLILFFMLRLPFLGSDITNSDAIRWHMRSEKFMEALVTGDLKATYQNYQPGVTLMWLNTTVKGAYTLYQKSNNEQVNTIYNAASYPLMHGISKALLVFVLAFILLYMMNCVEQVFDEKVAQFFGLFMATEIYLVGIDRWFHLTSLETYLGFASFLSILVWRKRGSTNWLKLSAVLFSLAVLSKLTTLIILPVLIFGIITVRHFKVKYLFHFFLVFLATTFLLFPALWIEPLQVLAKLWTAIVNATANDERSQLLTTFTSRFFYPLVLSYKLSPMTFCLSVISLILIPFSIKQKNILYTFFYFLIYFIALSISEKKIDRYAIALIPPLLLLISFYISKIGDVLQKLVYLIILLTSIWAFDKYNPVYSAYYSPIFGGAKSALRIGVFENSGEYFSQAAQYLNTKTGKFVVTVPNNRDAFSFYYKGDTVFEITNATHYLVWSHDIDRKEIPYFPECPYIDKTFGPSDMNYIYVFKCESNF